MRDLLRALVHARKFPSPPVCDHPERPEGKPLCAACWSEYKPKVDAWRDEGERQRGIGHA